MKIERLQVCIRPVPGSGTRYVVTLVAGPANVPARKSKETVVSAPMFFGSAEAFAESLRILLATGGAEVALGIAWPHAES